MPCTVGAGSLIDESQGGWLGDPLRSWSWSDALWVQLCSGTGGCCVKGRVGRPRGTDRADAILLVCGAGSPGSAWGAQNEC